MASYSSRNQCHHRDWHLTLHSLIFVFMEWELGPIVTRKGGPSREVEVTDDRDDAWITIWPGPLGKVVQRIALKEC